jgi:hypothetical protein
MTSSKIAIIILGLSGSGKDTFTSGVNYPILKFSGFIKRQVETLYELEPGSLDTEAMKDTLIRDVYGRQLKTTYRDILIAYFEAVQKTDPTAMCGYIKSEVRKCTENTIIFNDVRTIAEAEFIQDLFDNQVECVIIVREGKKGYVADRYINLIAEMFPGHMTVENDGTKADLIDCGKQTIELLRGLF